MFSSAAIHLSFFDLISYLILTAIVTWIAFNAKPSNIIYRGPAMAQRRHIDIEDSGYTQVSISWDNDSDLDLDLDLDLDREDFAPQSCIGVVSNERFYALFGADPLAIVPVQVIVTCDRWGVAEAQVL